MFIGQSIGPGNHPEQTVEALCKFGFDFMMVDNEHSLVDKETVFEYVRAGRKFDMPVLFRPEKKTSNFIPKKKRNER